jgi:hypothetical protein
MREFIGTYYGLIELFGVYGLVLFFLGREAWRYRPSKLRAMRAADEQRAATADAAPAEPASNGCTPRPPQSRL